MTIVDASTRIRRNPPGRLLRFLWLVGSGTIAAPAALADPPQARPAQPAGLYVVVDGSASMCGFLRADDPQKRFFTLLDFADGLGASGGENRLFLLKSGAAKAASPLVAPPSDLESYVGRTGFESRGNCAPLNAATSEIERVFEQPAWRSLVLVSDLQLDGAALTAFFGAFERWYAALPDARRAATSAGIVTLSVPFAGEHYPVTQPVKKHRDKNRPLYTMSEHERLLSIVWISTSPADDRRIGELFARLKMRDATRLTDALLYGLQVAPAVTEKPDEWLKSPGVLPSGVALFRKPTRQTVLKRFPPRSADAVNDCVGFADAKDGGLAIRLRQTCRDGKPPFDPSVERIDVTLQAKDAAGYRVALDTANAPPFATIDGDRIVLRLTAAAVGEFCLPLSILRDAAKPDADRLTALTVENEYCEAAGKGLPPAKAAAACVDRFRGRSVNYKSFVEGFEASAAGLRTSMLAAGAGTAQCPLRVVVERAVAR